MAFTDNLQQLPSIAHLAALELRDANNTVVATIENKPGKAGSLTVYAALAARHGSITPAAAHEGLVIFSEHTTDAKAHPGKHPNIDRLFEVIESGISLSAKLIPA